MKTYNEINVKPLSDGKSWEMKDWFAVELSYATGSIFIPTSFVLDFASIPRFFWRLIGPPATGKYRRGALVHDWLYATQSLSRKECDEIFHEIMIADGVNVVKQYTIYYVVRAFGGLAWAKKKKNKEKIQELLVLQRRILNEVKSNIGRSIYA